MKKEPIAPVETDVPLTDLKFNDKNPRSAWKPEQVDPFRESLQRFGDLGGIVRNLTTDRLVGGHKRVEVFRSNATVRIVKVEQPEDAQGTVAHGYVIVEGNRFAYREVRWSEAIEAAANLAANRWGAEWAWELVAGTLQSITDPELLALTGFPAHELSNLLAADWTPAARETLTTEDPDQRHAVHLTHEQYARLQEVKAHLDATLSDEQVIVHLCEGYLHGST